VAPLVPQAVLLGVVQTPLRQQPLGQVAELHPVPAPVQAPLVQTAPTGHSKHCAPLIPQAEVLLGVTQVPPLQQPLGHVLAVQVAVPQVMVLPVPETSVPELPSSTSMRWSKPSWSWAGTGQE
jgi:hypothetical protein